MMGKITSCRRDRGVSRLILRLCLVAPLERGNADSVRTPCLTRLGLVCLDLLGQARRRGEIKFFFLFFFRGNHRTCHLPDADRGKLLRRRKCHIITLWNDAASKLHPSKETPHNTACVFSLSPFGCNLILKTHMGVFRPARSTIGPKVDKPQVHL